MPSLTIRLDDELDARLRQHLARTGQSLSDFVRDSLAHRLDEAPRSVPRLEALDRALAGIEDDGDIDASTTYKARIRERLSARHRR